MDPKSREITPWHPIQGGIYGDEFKVGADYQNWRPRGTSDFLLIHTLDGSGRIAWADGMLDTRAGDALLYEPTARQDYTTHPSIKRWHLVWAHFVVNDRWDEWLQWPRVAPRIRLVHLPAGGGRDAFVAALRRVGQFSRRNERFSPALALNALEEALIRAAQTAEPRNVCRDPRIRKALELVADSACRMPTVEAIASACGLSASRFAHLFRQEIGASPARFAEIERLRRAASLLRLTRLPVSEIATKCGYENAFYFSNRFKKMYGLSPLAYRRQAAGLEFGHI